MHRWKICTVRDLSALVTFVRGDDNKRVHQQNVLVLFNTICHVQNILCIVYVWIVYTADLI